MKILILYACFMMTNADVTSQPAVKNLKTSLSKTSKPAHVHEKDEIRLTSADTHTTDEKITDSIHRYNPKDNAGGAEANMLNSTSGDEQMAFTAGNDIELSENTFFIINRAFSRARLAQFKRKKGKHVGTYEAAVYPDQLWFLKPSTSHPGYHYIVNAKYQYRLAKYGPKRYDVGVYNGNHYTDQLWKFEKYKDTNYYLIYNEAWSNCRLTKFCVKNTCLGTYDGKKYYTDQMWSLVPRFTVQEHERELFHPIDNRLGSHAIPYAITKTSGIKLTKSTTLSTKFSLEFAMKAALNGLELEKRFKKEISDSMNSSEEENWSTKTTITFTVPPGKYYRVLQNVVSFKSDLERDNMELLDGQLTIEESD